MDVNLNSESSNLKRLLPPTNNDPRTLDTHALRLPCCGLTVPNDECNADQWCGMRIVDGRNPKGENRQILVPDPKGEIGQRLVPRAKGKIGRSPGAPMEGADATPKESKRELDGRRVRLPGSVRASGLQRLTAPTWQWRL